MVIHERIDGFTRIPVFLKCSTNNRAETVLGQTKAAKILLSHVTTPLEGARERKHDHRSQCSQPKNRKVVA